METIFSKSFYRYLLQGSQRDDELYLTAWTWDVDEQVNLKSGVMVEGLEPEFTGACS